MAIRLSEQEAARHAPSAAPAPSRRGAGFSPMRGSGAVVSPRRRAPSPPSDSGDAAGAPDAALGAAETDPESAALIRAMLEEEEAQLAERRRVERDDEHKAALLALELEREDARARAAARAAAADRRARADAAARRARAGASAGTDFNAPARGVGDVARVRDSGGASRYGPGGRGWDDDEDPAPVRAPTRRREVGDAPRVGARSSSGRSGASSGGGSSGGASGSLSSRATGRAPPSARRTAATARARADRAGGARSSRRPAGGSALPPSDLAAHRAATRRAAAAASRAGVAADRDARLAPAAARLVPRSRPGPAAALPPGYSSSGRGSARAAPGIGRTLAGAPPSRGGGGASAPHADPGAGSVRVVGGTPFRTRQLSWDAPPPAGAQDAATRARDARVFGAAGRPTPSSSRSRLGGGPALR